MAWYFSWKQHTVPILNRLFTSKKQPEKKRKKETIGAIPHLPDPFLNFGSDIYIFCLLSIPLKELLFLMIYNPSVWILDSISYHLFKGIALPDSYTIAFFTLFHLQHLIK